MGERWIKEAEDLRAAGSSGTMSRNHNNPKVTWHVTVSPPGSFNAVHGVLTRNRSEPHFIYDPKTDRLGQYFACDRGARALANDGSTPTNRDGTINIQIEVCAWPGDIHSGQKGFTEIPEFDPNAPNFRALMRCIRSWGIPDRWPSGNVMRGSWASDSVSRSWSTYRKSGHFGHCHVPGNSHWDPGNIDMSAIFGKRGSNAGSSAPAPSKPKVEKYWTPTAKGYTTKDVQRIVGVKVDSYYGDDTKAAVKKLQKKLGVKADGYFGPRTASAYEASQKKGSGKKSPKAPAFPLPRGWYFGPKSGPKQSVSGYYSHRSDLRRWQQRMKDRGWSITPDGLYGNRTASVARAFQKEKGLAVDSLIGNDTWDAAWEEPVT